ncbi:putative bifunctional diguanylate cyclase/phosphodiesterase [Shewanella nanhaiensis]|uniref:EAL domain-containing protein n=1 Tax=Shewanella nanhaiensis TaxID=2864872 RepID=A0ABS7E139_9GAMM|nr:GGDEF domain-containing phosphodiesterase [Shewanella nanhaiensis]MBW8182727.1 EAL domain-containing protein [Shewanella nanhaiensis]
MNIKKWFNSKTAIIVAGILLTAYLFLILTVTNLGQSRLKESQNNALDLKISNYTDNLSFFFDVSQESIGNLANNRAISAYFSNLAAGMSMQYGLGSSLFNLRQTINSFAQTSKIDNHQIYRRLVVVGFGKTVIADTELDTPFDVNQIPMAAMEKVGTKILMLSTPEGPIITLLHTIYHQDKPAGILIAEIDNDVVIHQLSTQEHESNGSCLKLVTPLGEILVWDSLKPLAGLNPILKFTPTEPFRASTAFNPGKKQSHDNISSHNIYFEKEVSGTPFKLISWFEPVNEQDIFTSAWFIAGISLLALPVMLGLLYLMRVNNTNLVLQTQVAFVSEQQQKLTNQNVQLLEEVDKRKASENKLAYQATHDELTGLANRTHSMSRLAQSIESARVNNTKVLVMFLDLDNFKQVNDTVGHHAGDELLKLTSKRLLNSVRNTDTVARFGGDEFLIIIPELPHQNMAKMLASSILTLFEQGFKIEGQEFFVSTSIGMSIYPQDGDTAATLLKKADTSLYRAKDAGRNGFSFYNDSMNQDIQRKLTLNVRLHQAINLDDIEIYYQPILDLASRKIIGAEALMRWTDSELGVVSPDEFIPLAEKNGLIHKLGDIVLQRACSQAASWQSITPLKMAINFSSVQFRYSEQLQARIVEVLTQTGLPADRLDMEVTESLLIDQESGLMTMLAYLKQLGIEMSIDDFGTGYSALSYLQKFSFSKLKIDRAFINKMASSKADKALVTAILAMAKSLEMKVVAEGIEDEQQAQFLQSHGCEFGQGYLFSRPVTAEAFTQLLMEQESLVVATA